MSKNQKKKKSIVQSFFYNSVEADIDFAKEDEKLKKILEKANEVKHEDIDQIEDKQKTNLFSQDLFTKAQTSESKSFLLLFL